MPIRSELRQLYPAHWPEISRRVRFDRAGGKCERCQRPHGTIIRCLPDGRWFDPSRQTWIDDRGRPTRWLTLVEAIEMRTTRVILATAHLDNDPENNRLRNLHPRHRTGSLRAGTSRLQGPAILLHRDD